VNQDYKPTWRKPVGILGLVAALTIYAIGIAALSDLIGTWHVILQTIAYVVLGTVWLLPLRRFLIWMETGRWG
jgi:predicted tellurium resistance membrane protein TerC